MFTVHSIDTAPAASKPTLNAVKAAYGMVPNLFGVLAESPGALKAYFDVSKAFTDTSLSPAEQQVVLLATSVENACEYCVAAHSTVAKSRQLLDDAALSALHAAKELPDRKLEALRQFTVQGVRARGRVTDDAVRAFLDAGYTRADLLAVLTGVALKTLSNYTNHIAATPLDAAFQAQRWEPAAAA